MKVEREYNMIKVHVTPITPKSIFDKFLKDESVLINYLRPENYKAAVKDNHCKYIYIDNGAYTYFRKGITPNYDNFYHWLENKEYDYFFIPDVIDGNEQDNNNLIELMPNKFKAKSIPVYHLHEDLSRLDYLMNKDFTYIALGASGKYWNVGSDIWFDRMDEIMKILCNSNGYPKVRIHALRCLNPKVFIYFPFYSADSSNLAQNHSKRGALNMLNRLRCFDAPKKYDFKKEQLSIYDLLAMQEQGILL